MHALLIIGSALGGAAVGGTVGFWLGERGGGDYNFAPAIYAPLGALAGGLVGVVVAALRWA